MDDLVPSSSDDAPIALPDNRSISSAFSLSSGNLRNVVWTQNNSASGDDGITVRITKRAWPAIGQSLAFLDHGRMNYMAVYIFRETYAAGVWYTLSA